MSSGKSYYRDIEKLLHWLQKGVYCTKGIFDKRPSMKVRRGEARRVGLDTCNRAQVSLFNMAVSCAKYCVKRKYFCLPLQTTTGLPPKKKH